MFLLVPTLYGTLASREIFLCRNKREWWVREGTPSLALRVCESHRSYFRLFKRSKLIVSWFPERSTHFPSNQCCRDRTGNGKLCSLDVLPLQYSTTFALRQSHEDLITFQTIYLNVPVSQELYFRLIKTCNTITLVKFIYPDRGPKAPSLSHFSLLLAAPSSTLS